tara:strand:- start:3849 stop:5723 length:1875 start_codon:yes stop_codon:yes gene_type:complete
MCGIVGILNTNKEKVSRSILKKMTNEIVHRGPDGEGYYVDDYIGIGHRRLSILDLSEAGNQPMQSQNRRFVLSYNGEVYNFKELRSELQKLGYRFQSQTDSEVVLNSWVEWGEKCVIRFNGMFAFSIWDKRHRTLYLVRDRFGVKPLYYAKFGEVFLFASEQKAILQNPKAKKIIDKSALVEYFTFQNLFTNRTLMKDIKMLPPASVGKIRCIAQNDFRSKKYWDYNFYERTDTNDVSSIKEELDRLLKQAVSRQLVSDVELGAYLSGGIDSGTLTSIASRKLPNIKTFTCGFDLSTASGIELSFDERHEAEAMSAFFKTEQYEIVLKSGDMERCLYDFTYHLEEPRVGQSYPNYYVAKLASKFVKVILSGTGGDELFGGYPWRYFVPKNNEKIDDYIYKYYKFWQRLLNENELRKVFKPIHNEIKDLNTLDIFRNVFKNQETNLKRPQDFINNSLYFEANTFLHGLFVVEDKLSMAHSMETRVPFMDNDLVDFAMSCPVSLKLKSLKNSTYINENEINNKRNFKKTNDGKKILRRVMKNYVPKYLFEAQKKGFSAPDSSWFKKESVDFVKSKLFNKNALIYDFMDKKFIKSLVNEHFTDKNNRRLLIWSLINIEEYLKINFKN